MVVAPSRDEIEAADALIVELESLTEAVIAQKSIHTVASLLETIKHDDESVLVLSIESEWTADDWRNLDLQRSRLMRDGTTILVVGKDDVVLMVTAAPNLWSWIGGQVWSLRIEEDLDG